ncbi:MAG TPA: hypothetical protein VLB75_07980 [Steroidobacteraceae bacterium]|nr:hypothetical protein [Steroidobacteraceae bacterium]
MAKPPNYHHVRRQKELARKLRQQAKEQRKAARANTPEPGPAGEPGPASEK